MNGAGKGAGIGSLASEITGIRIVTGRGDILDVSATEHPEISHAARLSLGTLGIRHLRESGDDEALRLTAVRHVEKNAIVVNFCRVDSSVGWRSWPMREFLLVLPFVLVSHTAFAARTPTVVPAMAGVYDGVHRDWRDSVTLNRDGTYARGSGDSGTWSYDGTALVLKWKNWGPETLNFVRRGIYASSSAANFTLTARALASAEPVLGSYDAVHKDWRDLVTINADGAFTRAHGEGGTWLFDGTTLVLAWRNWAAESVELGEAGRLVARDGRLRMTRRDEAKVAVPQQPERVRHIRVNKAVYKANETIVLSYSAMKGTSTDWTNVIGATEATDEWGNWEYTNGSDGGTRTVKPLPAGEYEARAYFEGSTDLVDRVKFRVIP